MLAMYIVLRYNNELFIQITNLWMEKSSSLREVSLNVV